MKQVNESTRFVMFDRTSKVLPWSLLVRRNIGEKDHEFISRIREFYPLAVFDPNK